MVLWLCVEAAPAFTFISLMPPSSGRETKFVKLFVKMTKGLELIAPLPREASLRFSGMEGRNEWRAGGDRSSPPRVTVTLIPPARRLGGKTP